MKIIESVAGAERPVKSEAITVEQLQAHLKTQDRFIAPGLLFPFVEKVGDDLIVTAPTYTHNTRNWATAVASYNSLLPNAVRSADAALPAPEQGGEVEPTPGPWRVDGATPEEFVIVSPWSKSVRPGNTSGYADYRGRHIASLRHQGDNPCVSEAQAAANARYIVAAVNACRAAGLSMEQLEAGVVKETRSLVADYAALIGNTGYAVSRKSAQELWGRAQAVLATSKEAQP